MCNNSFSEWVGKNWLMIWAPSCGRFYKLNKTIDQAFQIGPGLASWRVVDVPLVTWKQCDQKEKFLLLLWVSVIFFSLSMVRKGGRKIDFFFQVHEKEKLVQYFWCGKFKKEKLQEINNNRLNSPASLMDLLWLSLIFFCFSSDFDDKKLYLLTP